VHLITIGREKVNPDETYLWIFNHQSFLDSFIFVAVANQFVVTTGAAYQFKLPIWGFIMRRWGAIPIERSNIRQAYRSLQKAKNVLLNGSSVQISPEGKRTLDGKLGKFKNGPFRLAIDANVPIVPIGIKGAYEIKKRTDWRFRPGRVTATIGDPIHPQEYAEMSAKELSLYVRDIIKKMIK
jgi:1-acyl-sn-glycerol-3-phosphate acyltransferase